MPLTMAHPWRRTPLRQVEILISLTEIEAPCVVQMALMNTHISITFSIIECVRVHLVAINGRNGQRGATKFDCVLRVCDDKFRTAPSVYAYLQREGSRHVSWSNGAGRCTNINSKKLNSTDHRHFEYARIASSLKCCRTFFFSCFHCSFSVLIMNLNSYFSENIKLVSKIFFFAHCISFDHVWRRSCCRCWQPHPVFWTLRLVCDLTMIKPLSTP